MDAVCLRALQHRFPTVATALAEIAHLQGIRTLPRPTIHVVSDIHGEFRKLEHIIRNGVDLRRSDPPRLVDEVAGLEELVTTYQTKPR